MPGACGVDANFNRIDWWFVWGQSNRRTFRVDGEVSECLQLWIEAFSQLSAVQLLSESNINYLVFYCEPFLGSVAVFSRFVICQLNFSSDVVTGKFLRILLFLYLLRMLELPRTRKFSLSLNCFDVQIYPSSVTKLCELVTCLLMLLELSLHDLSHLLLTPCTHGCNAVMISWRQLL
jgi:hypothetical protein